MCAIDGLQDRINREHNELDKEVYSDLVEAKIIIHRLEKKLCQANVEKAKLSIQAIAV